MARQYLDKSEEMRRRTFFTTGNTSTAEFMCWTQGERKIRQNLNYTPVFFMPTNHYLTRFLKYSV
jgi:hypothetical protein